MTVNHGSSDHGSGEKSWPKGSETLLVSPQWLEQNQQDATLVIVDVRTTQEYAEGHIPGALNLELSRWTTVRDGVQGMLLEAGDFAELVGSAGIDNETTVVLYDANWGMPAARVLWSFRRFGHDKAFVLNGGWDQWEAEQRRTSTEPAPVRASAQFNVRPAEGDEHLAELEWLRSQEGRSDLVVLDTRSPAEFEQGHLPNAINWDWLNGVPVGEWDAVGPAEELRAELAQLGVTPEQEIVTYCRSGARAAHTYMVLRHLGFPRVRNYDGSWLEWSYRVLGKAAH